MITDDTSADLGLLDYGIDLSVPPLWLSPFTCCLSGESRRSEESKHKVFHLFPEFSLLERLPYVFFFFVSSYTDIYTNSNAGACEPRRFKATMLQFQMQARILQTVTRLDVLNLRSLVLSFIFAPSSWI